MDNKTLVAFSLTLFACFFSTFAVAEQQDTVDNVWHVLHIEGVTQAKKDNDWRDLSLGQELTSPTFLRTDKDSRIVLKHRNDKITIASNSLLKLEEEKYTEEGIITKIIQTIGYALFDIEKNTGRQNIVETSYLLSVVKGTTFTVQVTEKQTIVDLIEGQLEVKATRFNASTIINAGQIAQLAKGDSTISVVDASTTVRPQTLIKGPAVRGKSQDAHDKKVKSKPVKKDLPSNKNNSSIDDNSVPATHNSKVKDTVLISNGVVDIVLPGNNGRRGMGNNGKGKGNIDINDKSNNGNTLPQ